MNRSYAGQAIPLGLLWQPLNILRDKSRPLFDSVAAFFPYALRRHAPSQSVILNIIPDILHKRRLILLDAEQIVTFAGNYDLCSLSLAIQSICHNQTSSNIHLLQQFLHRRDFIALPIYAFAGKGHPKFGQLRTDDMQRPLVALLSFRGTHGLSVHGKSEPFPLFREHLPDPSAQALVQGFRLYHFQQA